MSQDSNQRLIEEARFLAIYRELPRTLQEAFEQYFARRRQDLLGPIMSVKTFEAEEIKNRVNALDQIAERLKADIKVKSKLKVLPGPDEDRVLHDVMLARLLTPAGWREVYKPIVDGLVADAIERILKGESIGLNQAVGDEARRFYRHLDGIEKNGHIALAKLERKSRAVGPLRPQGTARLAV